MRFLIDTHCWLWYLLSPEKLNEDTRELLQNPEHEIYLSAASAWEIVIKHDLGKLELPLKPTEYIPKRLEALGHESLPITQEHVLRIHGLPVHHKDPFDRLLIAQAQADELDLITADRKLKLYDLTIVWARSGKRAQKEAPSGESTSPEAETAPQEEEPAAQQEESPPQAEDAGAAVEEPESGQDA